MPLSCAISVSSLDVLHVGAADVHVEEHRVAVAVLLAAPGNRNSRGSGFSALGRPGFSSTASTAKLKVATPASPSRSITSGRSSRRIGGHVDPEALLGRVVDHLVDELRAQQRLAAHQRQHAAGGRVQPVDRAPRHVLGHALHAVVERPAVVAIQIAFPLREQVGDDGVKIARQHARLDIGKQPAAHGAIDDRPRPSGGAPADARIPARDRPAAPGAAEIRVPETSAARAPAAGSGSPSGCYLA